MEISQDSLLKFFYSNNERMECSIIINTKVNKKKKNILVLTVSLSKPVSINIYIVKSGEKGEIKPNLVSNAKSLSAVNCHDYEGVQSYDIEFKCVDGKIKRIFASAIEDKHRYIERLMRVIYLHDINLFNKVIFNNLPESINPDYIYSEWNAEKNDFESQKIFDQSGHGDETDFSRYLELSSAEEENMQRFLNETPGAVINAMEFQETLRRHLLAMDGTNVHSIMSSESQMLKLMEDLDLAIEHVELLESKIDIQDLFLAEIEDSMVSLGDRDEMIRLTSKNKDKVQTTLENILYQLNLDEVHQEAMKNVIFTNPVSVDQARIGAEKLRLLLEQPIEDGLDKMTAVREKSTNLNQIAEDFARNFANQFNSALMRHVNKLMALSASSFEKLIEVHRNSRAELVPYVDFMDWLKIMRPKSCNELQKVYTDKMATVYDQEINAMTELVKAKLVVKDKHVATNATKTTLHPAPRLRHRSKNNSESSSVGNSETVGFESILEDFLSNLKPLVLEEEEFITRLFRLDCRGASERPVQPSIRSQAYDPNSIYLFYVSGQIFNQLSSQLKTLVQLLEQHDPSQSLIMVVIVNRQFDDSVQASELLQRIWGVLFQETKRSFNSYIDRFIGSFWEIKAPKKSRCGILPFVTMYEVFAEQTSMAFRDSMRPNDFVSAHQKIIREIICHIDRVADEPSKVPKEVIIMENHHKMKDILRHLKWPELDELYEELKNKYDEALENYVIFCVGKPFEKLYIFLEDVNAAIDSGIKCEDIGYKFKFTRTELKKVIHEYPGREVKKGLEHLCKKVEKFVSEDSGLFQVVWLSIQKQFMTGCQYYESLIDKCYPHSNIRLEFTMAELEQYFKEIASTR